MVFVVSDRRYRQARGASLSSDRRGEALARASASRARRRANRNASFGGSTGGRQSAQSGGAVSSIRGDDRQQRRAVFESAGSGSLGGEQEIKRASRQGLMRDQSGLL